MNHCQNQEQIQFLITQEKQSKQGDTSQEKLSFNLSVTIKNSSVKATPNQCKVSVFPSPSPGKQDNLDPNDFFENFDKYYKIEGLTPIKFSSLGEDKQSPMLRFQDIQIDENKWGQWSELEKEEPNQLDNNLEDNSSKQNNPFYKKHNKIHLPQEKENRRLKEILKEKSLKSIANLQSATEIIKINNISPLLIGCKTRIAERKNTPIGMLGKKSKTICNSRKSNSVIGSKRLINSQYPSIFCDKKKLSELFKPAESWGGLNEGLVDTKTAIFPCNRQFQIHKKTKFLKRRPSNSSWGEDVCIASPKFNTIRI